MIHFLIATMLLQAAPEPCNAIDPPPSGCPAWTLLNRGSGGDVLDDPASVRRQGDSFDLRVRMIFTRDLPGGMRSAIAIYRFDCGARTASLRHRIVYNARGERLVEGPPAPKDAGPLPAPQGSPNRAALDRYCPH
jgi:hypothetical protein